jgi:tRNA threonylcarbamoyladenosine biosynthesis protein TsaB
MNILAIDTATEQCSVAIVTDDAAWSRVVPTARSHADMILPMIDELLTESGFTLAQIEGLAFGRGPGSFTGVRIAVSVIQGLALARQLTVVGISNLATVAQQAAQANNLSAGEKVLVCMDARMQEVYWALYEVDTDGFVRLVGVEQVSAPSTVDIEAASVALGVGTGWRAYPELRNKYASLRTDDSLLPRAIEIAQLSRNEFEAGRATTAANAQPVYLRDQVVSTPRQC